MEWFTPSLPAYAQIAQTLRTQIENKELGPDDKLPAKRSIMEQLKVSRMTIRHARKSLRSEGLICRKRGRGGDTFIATAPPLVEINGMEGLLTQMRESDMKVDSTLIH